MLLIVLQNRHKSLLWLERQETKFYTLVLYTQNFVLLYLYHNRSEIAQS